MIKKHVPQNKQFIESNANYGLQHDDWTRDIPGVCERIKNGHRFEKEKLSEPVK